MHALIACDHARRFWVEAQAWSDFTMPRFHPLTLLCSVMLCSRTPIVKKLSRLSSRNSWTHDRGSYDPVQSIKMAQEALAVLEVPKRYAAILSGPRWRPPEET
jgi:hypothetical protein